MNVPLVSSDGLSNAVVALDGVTDEEYKQLSDLLGRELERTDKTYVGVAAAMATAVRICPNANPADLWVHLIYNQFRTRFGRSDQSWKRVSGQAFEQLIISIYAARLVPLGIVMRTSIPLDATVLGLRAKGLGGSKTDIILQGLHRGSMRIFGVIHVKASIAERLNDDTPASMALISEGYWSALATLDAKMFPPPHGDGVVRGEFGFTKQGDKRRYFEVAGQFSGCFSFNTRTPETLTSTKAVSKIVSLTFSDPQPDKLVTAITDAWARFSATLA